MLAQTCPMTTLTVVNVDAVDHPAAPHVHDCRRRARSCKIARVQCPTGTSQFVRIGGRSWAGTRTTDDPHGQVRRPPRAGPPSGRPDRLVEAPRQGPHCGRMGVSVAAGHKRAPRTEPTWGTNSTECRV